MGLLVALGWQSCSNTSLVNYNNPKSVVRAYYHALGQQDYDRLFALGTPEAQQVFNVLRNLYELLPKKRQITQQTAAQTAVQDYKKVICTIQGNTATCDLCCNAEGQDLGIPLTLKRINKQWLIHMPHATPKSS